MAHTGQAQVALARKFIDFCFFRALIFFLGGTSFLVCRLCPSGTYSTSSGIKCMVCWMFGLDYCLLQWNAQILARTMFACALNGGLQPSIPKCGWCLTRNVFSITPALLRHRGIYHADSPSQSPFCYQAGELFQVFAGHELWTRLFPDTKWSGASTSATCRQCFFGTYWSGLGA